MKKKRKDFSSAVEIVTRRHWIPKIYDDLFKPPLILQGMVWELCRTYKTLSSRQWKVKRRLLEDIAAYALVEYEIQEYLKKKKS